MKFSVSKKKENETFPFFLTVVVFAVFLGVLMCVPVCVCLCVWVCRCVGVCGWIGA